MSLGSGEDDLRAAHLQRPRRDLVAHRHRGLGWCGVGQSKGLVQVKYWTPTSEVSEWLQSHYADESGVLVFRVTGKPVKLSTMKSGHRVLTIRNLTLGLCRQVYAHRLVYFLHHGHFHESRLDHKDLDKSNNCIENLRLATAQQNTNNVPKRKNYAGRSFTSNYKGVFWNKQVEKWAAVISVDGRQIKLGVFENEVDAATAYTTATMQHNGKFGRGST